MCYHFKQSKQLKSLEKNFGAKANVEASAFEPSAHINGFDFRKTPIITGTAPQQIQCYHWGLIPSWSKDEHIRKHCLNAKIETLHEKPSFKNVQHNRCLVLAESFYEWQWLDRQGKRKQKYEISVPTQEVFAFGGLHSTWQHSQTNQPIHTFTIVTTEANELMAEIHNMKKRMPIILTKENEQAWLDGTHFDHFKHLPIDLSASKMYQQGQNLSLF